MICLYFVQVGLAPGKRNLKRGHEPKLKINFGSSIQCNAHSRRAPILRRRQPEESSDLRADSMTVNAPCVALLPPPSRPLG